MFHKESLVVDTTLPLLCPSVFPSVVVTTSLGRSPIVNSLTRGNPTLWTRKYKKSELVVHSPDGTVPIVPVVPPIGVSSAVDVWRLVWKTSTLRSGKNFPLNSPDQRSDGAREIGLGVFTDVREVVVDCLCLPIESLIVPLSPDSVNTDFVEWNV